MKRKWDKALVDFQKAEQADSNNTELLSNRALVYFSLGNYKAAIPDLLRYLHAIPDNPENHNQLGLAYLYTGEAKLALAEMNKAVALQPQQSAYYANRALVYRVLKNPAAEKADLLKAQTLGYPVDSQYLQQLR